MDSVPNAPIKPRVSYVKDRKGRDRPRSHGWRFVVPKANIFCWKFIVRLQYDESIKYLVAGWKEDDTIAGYIYFVNMRFKSSLISLFKHIITDVQIQRGYFDEIASFCLLATKVSVEYGIRPIKPSINMQRIRLYSLFSRNKNIIIFPINDRRTC